MDHAAPVFFINNFMKQTVTVFNILYYPTPKCSFLVPIPHVLPVEHWETSCKSVDFLLT